LDANDRLPPPQVHRLHPAIVPTFNPWIGVERVGKKSAKAAATRVEAYTRMSV